MTQVTGGKRNNKHADQNVLSNRPLNNTQPWKFEEGRTPYETNVYILEEIM